MNFIAPFMAVMLASLQPALASLPVPKIFFGCVANGIFKNEQGYTITIRRQAGQALDLSRWERQRLRISGNLLPGDNFYLTDEPVVVGTCR